MVEVGVPLFGSDISELGPPSFKILKTLGYSPGFWFVHSHFMLVPCTLNLAQLTTCITLQHNPTTNSNAAQGLCTALSLG